MTVVDCWLRLDERKKIVAVNWPGQEPAGIGLDELKPGRIFNRLKGLAGQETNRLTLGGVEFDYQEIDNPPEGSLLLLKRADSDREQLYRRALDEINDGIQIYDRNATLVYMNKTSRRMLGLPAHMDFEGQHLLNFYDLDEEVSSVMTALRTRQPVINRFDNFKAPGGRMVSSVNTAYPVFFRRELSGAVNFEQNLESIEAQVDLLEERKKMIHTRIGQPASHFSGYQFSDLIGRNRDLSIAVALARKIAVQDCNVLLVGETGTGKEIFAQSIYRASRRHKKKFVAINCAAVPDTLIESVFFGTSKGSFTGSVDKPGLLEEAKGGTLFLDELNSMSLGMQSKLLRVIQENSFRRVGGTKDIETDVRFISSCNDSPSKLIENNSLRKDLFYRLSTVSIEIPPLRERLDDLDELSRTYLTRQSRHYLKNIEMIPPPIMELFQKYHWPGNIRELFNVLDYILNTMDGDKIELFNLPRTMRELHQANESEAGRAGYARHRPAMSFEEPLRPYFSGCSDLNGLLTRLEKAIIEGTLLRCRYNVSRAAACLNIGRQTLQYRMKKLGLDAGSARTDFSDVQPEFEIVWRAAPPPAGGGNDGGQ
ncbi:transcriptional regulator [Deltaproteobacteria bacterium Smac51]|nr:transcriptional regulator [Deltaproteobacteria bacterium Smac51]